MRECFFRELGGRQCTGSMLHPAPWILRTRARSISIPSPACRTSASGSSLHSHSTSMPTSISLQSCLPPDFPSEILILPPRPKKQPQKEVVSTLHPGTAGGFNTALGHLSLIFAQANRASQDWEGWHCAEGKGKALQLLGIWVLGQLCVWQPWARSHRCQPWAPWGWERWQVWGW